MEGPQQTLEYRSQSVTAFHSQTDGQTERINTILKQYLRIYSNYQQDNWSGLLSTAEFTYNNTISATTGMTPFFANYRFHPRWEFNVKPDVKAPPPETVLEYVGSIKNLIEYLRLEIQYQQSIQAESANRSRLPAPNYKVGDEVWLHKRFINTTRPSNKLDHKRLGRFRIIEKISSYAFKLALPPSMKIHPVFHVSLLEPAATDPLPGQVNPPPPPIEVEGELEWEVEEILDSRKRRNKIQYLVKWIGDDHPTWEPSEFLANAPALISDFHHHYPTKPRP